MFSIIHTCPKILEKIFSKNARDNCFFESELKIINRVGIDLNLAVQ